MNDSRLQFYSLYLTRFASSFGIVTVLTLLPTYIDELGATGVTIGVFITALELARTAAVVPLGWAGDRFDKRTVLLGALGLSVTAYAAFAVVGSIPGFVVARTLQGLALVGTGLIGLSLVGELAPEDDRANYIGKYNSWRMAAGIAGTLGAGALYEAVSNAPPLAPGVTGFTVVFGLLCVLLVAALVGVWLFIDPDETSVAEFAFLNHAFNRRIVTLTSFRAQYAVAVTLVRKWLPIFVGVSVARGGLGMSAFVVGAVIAAEKFTNMLCQPYTGQLSDRYGRALFVFAGGGTYGLVALVIPFAGSIGEALGTGLTVPMVGTLPPAVLVVIALNGLLGIADSFREPASMALFADEGQGRGIASSFGVRSLVWRPGSTLAPLLGGALMSRYGIEWVFVAGGLAALSGVVVFFGMLSRDHGRRALTQW
jgi:MFS family permease